MKKLLEKTFTEKNIEINDEKLEKFVNFYDYLIKINENINLTRIISKEDVAKKHFLDSIFSSNYIPLNSSVVDVGAGGGFPSIPLKIFRPDLKMTMIDSVEKKVNFLNECVKNLQLENSTAIHCRVEDFANDVNYREGFDVCVSRAVASLNILVEYCLPLVKVGGIFIAYKGASVNEEIEQAKNAIKLLGGKIENIVEYNVFDDVKNYLVIIKKLGRTPKQFPRRKNLPRKQPL